MALQPPFALGYIGNDYLTLVRAAAWLKRMKCMVKSSQFVPAEMEHDLWNVDLCTSKVYGLDFRSCSNLPAAWGAEERGSERWVWTAVFS